MYFVKNYGDDDDDDVYLEFCIFKNILFVYIYLFIIGIFFFVYDMRLNV